MRAWLSAALLLAWWGGGASVRASVFAPGPGAPRGFRNWQLASNTVFRWEYRPGSALFLVWTQNRNGYEPTVFAESWRVEYGNLFGLHPANTLLVKVAYWLNR